MEELLILKTNIRFKKDLGRIAPLLDGHPAIQQWNIDLKDTDKVLRVKTSVLAAAELNNLLQTAGYRCEQLED